MRHPNCKCYKCKDKRNKYEARTSQTFSDLESFESSSSSSSIRIIPASLNNKQSPNFKHSLDKNNEKDSFSTSTDSIENPKIFLPSFPDIKGVWEGNSDVAISRLRSHLDKDSGASDFLKYSYNYRFYIEKQENNLIWGHKLSKSNQFDDEWSRAEFSGSFSSPSDFVLVENTPTNVVLPLSAVGSSEAKQTSSLLALPTAAFFNCTYINPTTLQLQYIEAGNGTTYVVLVNKIQ